MVITETAALLCGSGGLVSIRVGVDTELVEVSLRGGGLVEFESLTLASVLAAFLTGLDVLWAGVV